MYKLNPSLSDFWKTRKPYKILKGGRFCHAIGEKVVMFDGTIKKVEGVCEGDFLLGPDSKPREVLDVHSGHDDLFTVHQSGGKSYTVNSAHILALKRASKTAGEGKKLIGGGNSKRHDYGETLTMNVVEYMNSSDKFKSIYRGYKPLNIEFTKKKLLLDPYFMGLWLGDGMSCSATITTMDDEIVDFIMGYADKLKLNVIKRDMPKNRASNYHMVSPSRKNPISEALRHYDIFTLQPIVNGKKSRLRKDKRIPHDYLTSTRKDRLKVLAGLIDSDGTYNKNRGVMVISSSNGKLAEDIKYLVDSLGFKSSLIKRKTSCQNGNNGEAWFVSFSGALSEIPCLVKRKKAKDSKREHGLCGLKVEPAGQGEYVGFTVSGDHLYLLDDFTVLHNSSKTQDAGGMAAFLARNYSLKFMCLRQFQNRIADSVYTVIKEKIEQAGWQDEFDIGKSTIRHKVTGSEFIFYGIARNIADIKGTEGVDICWIEEGEGLTSEQWQIIDPTIRKQGSEIWLLYNPKFQTDFVITELPRILGDDCLIRHINYDENPFLSDTARAKAERLKETDEETYNHIYLGQPLTDQDSVIIKRSWLDSCVDAHLKIEGMDSGRAVVGYDVADSGDDKNATTYAKGSIIYSTDEWQGLEDKLQESTARAWNLARAKSASLVYDSIGVGAGVGSKANELNEANSASIEHRAFNAGGKVIDPDSWYDEDAKIKNKDHFANVKAQAWWLFADRVRKTYEAVNLGKEYPVDQLISFDSSCPNLERLLVELSTPRKAFDGNGRVKVESKDDMKKRDIKSPNLADSAIMCYAPTETIAQAHIYIPKRRR